MVDGRTSWGHFHDTVGPIWVVVVVGWAKWVIDESLIPIAINKFGRIASIIVNQCKLKKCYMHKTKHWHCMSSLFSLTRWNSQIN